MDIVNCKIRELGSHVGEQVTVKGWIHLKRQHGKKLVFLTLRDGTGFTQVVVRSNASGYGELLNAYREAAVRVVGTVTRDERSPYGYEIRAESVDVISPSSPTIEEEYQPDSSPDVLLSKRHLVIRGEKTSAILKYTAKLLKYFREFCEERGLVEVLPPLITRAACEGGATLFPIKYFDEVAYLTQSSQLYLEAALPALGDVYCIQKSFRAEKSRTRRHLTEYTHAEVELTFIDFDDLVSFTEDLIVHIVERTLEEDEPILKTLNVDDLKAPKKPFKRLTYREAVRELKKRGVEIGEGGEIEEAMERMLVDQLGEPLFLTEFPASQKAFYFKRKEGEEEITLSMDLLVPGVGEIIGGGMREDDYETLLTRLKEIKANLDDYKWYLDLRRYGSIPHGGFGLGVERTVEWILKLPHIREACLFPRLINRLTP
ncbi:MAG: asparagine--tRNA ligase [Candidatus Freyarchaeota archaeon]|nr:asparagine--tRNA ligase [Candidatus Freyrarchaeum guaymaensis]